MGRKWHCFLTLKGGYSIRKASLLQLSKHCFTAFLSHQFWNLISFLLKYHACEWTLSLMRRSIVGEGAFFLEVPDLSPGWWMLMARPYVTPDTCLCFFWRSPEFWVSASSQGGKHLSVYFLPCCVVNLNSSSPSGMAPGVTIASPREVIWFLM